MKNSFDWYELKDYLPNLFVSYTQLNLKEKVFLIDDFIYLWDGNPKSPIQYRCKKPIHFKNIDFIDITYEYKKSISEKLLPSDYNEDNEYSLCKTRASIWNTQINWDTRLEYRIPSSVIKEMKAVDFTDFYLSKNFDLRLESRNFINPEKPIIKEQLIFKENEAPTVTLSSIITEGFDTSTEYIQIILVALNVMTSFYQSPKTLQLFCSENGELFYLVTDAGEPYLQALGELHYGYRNSDNEWVSNLEGWSEVNVR